MHFNTKDLTGKVFGKITVDGFSYSEKHPKNTRLFWNCTCECGNKIIVAGCHLTDGHTKSCGCLKKELTSRLNKTHNMRHSRFYGSWQSMLGRCHNKSNPAYPNYGGRGIEVCDKWKAFENFYNDMYPTYSENLTIDRIDNNGSYSYQNCKWSTPQEQANNRRSNRLVKFNGEIKTLAEWCRYYNLTYKTIHKRLKDGWSVEKAFTTIKL